MSKIDELDYQRTEYIVCPMCGYSHPDSWETQESGMFTCENCENEFHVEIETTVTYTSLLPDTFQDMKDAEKEQELNPDINIQGNI